MIYKLKFEPSQSKLIVELVVVLKKIIRSSMTILLDGLLCRVASLTYHINLRSIYTILYVVQVESENTAK